MQMAAGAAAVALASQLMLGNGDMPQTIEIASSNSMTGGWSFYLAAANCDIIDTTRALAGQYFSAVSTGVPGTVPARTVTFGPMVAAEAGSYKVCLDDNASAGWVDTGCTVWTQARFSQHRGKR